MAGLTKAQIKAQKKAEKAAKKAAAIAAGQAVENDNDEGAEDEAGNVVIVNRGPQDYRESKQAFPVGQEVTVTEDVAGRLVNDFQGSKFHSFEVVDGAEPAAAGDGETKEAEPDAAGDGENKENGGGQE